MCAAEVDSSKQEHVEHDINSSLTLPFGLHCSCEIVTAATVWCSAGKTKERQASLCWFVHVCVLSHAAENVFFYGTVDASCTVFCYHSQLS